MSFRDNPESGAEAASVREARGFLKEHATRAITPPSQFYYMVHDEYRREQRERRLKESHDPRKVRHLTPPPSLQRSNRGGSAAMPHGHSCAASSAATASQRSSSQVSGTSRRTSNHSFLRSPPRSVVSHEALAKPNGGVGFRMTAERIMNVECKQQCDHETMYTDGMAAHVKHERNSGWSMHTTSERFQVKPASRTEAPEHMPLSMGVESRTPRKANAAGVGFQMTAKRDIFAPRVERDRAETAAMTRFLRTSRGLTMRRSEPTWMADTQREVHRHAHAVAREKREIERLAKAEIHKLRGGSMRDAGVLLRGMGYSPSEQKAIRDHIFLPPNCQPVVQPKEVRDFHRKIGELALWRNQRQQEEEECEEGEEEASFAHGGGGESPSVVAPEGTGGDTPAKTPQQKQQREEEEQPEEQSPNPHWEGKEQDVEQQKEKREEANATQPQAQNDDDDELYSTSADSPRDSVERTVINVDNDEEDGDDGAEKQEIDDVTTSKQQQQNGAPNVEAASSPQSPPSSLATATPKETEEEEEEEERDGGEKLSSSSTAATRERNVNDPEKDQGRN